MVKTKAQQIMADREARSEQEATRAILDIAAEFEPYIIRQRRHFHKHPEPSLEEVRTTSDIAGQLDAMNIPYERPLKTGLVATLRGTAPDAYRADGTPRRRLLMRADIDALPVTERTEEEFASVNEGYMHACGHDCHIAMMLGCLQVLRHMTDDIHGEVRVVFQPSEENGSGAKMMCEAGVCEDVDGAFAMHIWSEVDAGTVSCEPGPRMANTDWFRIDVHGTSCHGAMPQRGADAIMVAAEIVNALQTIVSRDLSPYEPAVVTVGELHGGTARNVIAGSAYLTGTVRTYSDATHEMMPELIRRICTHTAAALGAEAELSDYTIANYKVENEPAASERCRQAVLKVLGAAGEGRYRGTLSGEDFSEYLRRVPGVLAFVGCRNPQVGATFAQHSCYYRIDESVLAKGAAVAAQYAVDFLAEPTQEELDGPLVARIAESNPALADTVRSARAATVGAHHALKDAREARMTAARELRRAHAKSEDEAEDKPKE
ncbi:amidohydrolase [Collinsella phocaeensis]|uniref:amidohydrolase n=1 Tax=Collinsella phocaeensis TaxID=1871016 RepID=UPI00093204DA|nr:amidohydrolase [Collinsella phocaeensis]